MLWSEYLQFQYLGLFDALFAVFLMIFIYFISKGIQRKHIENEPHYRYYLKGLYVKLIGSACVCLIYVYYYQGGDTMGYYFDSTRLVNLFLVDPYDAIRITLGISSTEANEIFWFKNNDWLIYLGDHNSFFVVRLTWVLCLLSFKSFIGQAMLLAWLSYFPLWRLYETLIYEFPKLTKQFAFAIFFVPSVFFWGSGLLKDTITFSAVALFTSSLHQIIVRKKKIASNFIYLIIASILMIKIKSYIFFALLPGSLLWFAGVNLYKVKNKLVRLFVGPLLMVSTVGLGWLFLANLGAVLGDYAIENVLTKAVITQQDLKSDYYHGSSFDIGDFDPTFRGVLRKVPAAINAALFRPYLWEAHNPTMVMSGIENFCILIFTIYLLLKLKIYNLFKLMFRQRILFFTIFFSLFFAFSVGLTTSNFGSMVRYKIPAIPFFLVSLFVISNTYKEMKEKIED